MNTNPPSNQPALTFVRNLDWRNVAIVVLVLAICFATWRCDVNKGKVTQREAADARQGVISSVTAGRGAMRDREANTYPTIDRGIADIEAQRGKIKAEERKTKPRTRKDVENDTNNTTKGDIRTLARMFTMSGYSCAVR